MKRVFIDINSGGFYKADKPKNSSDAERPCITEEFLVCLTSEPQALVDIDAKVATLSAQRKK
jgi:hypothetical protein